MRKQFVLAATMFAAMVASSYPVSATVRYTASELEPSFSFTHSFVYDAPTFLASDGVLLPGSLSDCSTDFGNAACLPGVLKAQMIFSSLPEPAIWTMLFLGLGALGATIRRRHVAIRRLSDGILGKRPHE